MFFNGDYFSPVFQANILQARENTTLAAAWIYMASAPVVLEAVLEHRKVMIMGAWKTHFFTLLKLMKCAAPLSVPPASQM